MIKTNIICIGSIKESYFKDAVNEYVKRLSKFTKLTITELPETKLTIKNDKDIEIIKQRETNNIISKLSGYVILLDVKGQAFSSEKLAYKIIEIANTNSTITFVIGGSYGTADLLNQYINLNLSFSDFTMPHQLMRVVLLEQIYRAFTIINNITYHK